MEREDLVELVEAVWQTTMGGDINFCPCQQPEEPYDGHWSAAVHFTGDWTGLLLITLPNRSARRLAASMFQLSPGEVSDADMGDATGEVANILGGNFKALLPPPSALSLPSVYKGDLLAQGVIAAESDLVQSLCFEVDGEQLSVRVIQDQSATA